MTNTAPSQARGGRALLAFLAVLATAPVLAQPDYSMLDDLLQSHVQDGFVDYDGIALDPRLDDFITQLASTAPTDLTSTAEQKAFYINAYNAIALRGILNGQSPDSFFGRARFFKRMRVDVLGESLSLEDIEHGRLRPLGDSRIHFAIVCASLSCPVLASRAYLPATLDAQLDAAAEQFLNDPTRNVFDSNRRVASISKIFDWFEGDFVGNAGSLQNYLARYVTDPTSARLLRTGSFKVKFLAYDWSLNGQLTK